MTATSQKATPTWANVQQHTVYHGDCGDVLPTLNEGEVQLVCTSPPYAFGKDYEEGFDEYMLGDLIRATAKKLLRVVKPSGFCFINFPSTTRFNMLPEQMYTDAFRDAGFIFHSKRVWKKPFAMVRLGPSGINLSVGAAEFENIFTFRKPPNAPERVVEDGVVVRDYNRKFGVRTIWDLQEHFRSGCDIPLPPREAHPALMPAELPIMAIRLWTQPGDIVLDPFGGLFTTVLSAHHEDRVGIGIEKDEGYYAMGRLRLQQYVSQGVLF